MRERQLQYLQHLRKVLEDRAQVDDCELCPVLGCLPSSGELSKIVFDMLAVLEKKLDGDGFAGVVLSGVLAEVSV